MSREDEIVQIPDIICDDNAEINYKKGRFFGKGGFAKCYEIINMTNDQAFAGKIVPKKGNQNQKERMTQEIEIHQSLKHKNVVGFHSFFEDNFHIYIVLELCRNRSMLELLKRREIITEPETRFYMKQILDGVSYLHQRCIIHRDLKPGNLFLNDDLHVKIGDFGLAATIENEREHKKTVCGTPNYVAPEILQKKGHSFEVDIWSIGCIMYTLLIGKPPFETSTLKETYSRINKCEYKIAGNITDSAKQMIMAMLQLEPKNRPKSHQLVSLEFLVNGYCPPSLPVSCLTMAPRFDKLKMLGRKPLGSLTNGEQILKIDKKTQSNAISVHVTANQHYVFDAKGSLISLRSMLSKLLKMKPAKNHVFLDEMTDPAYQPMIWVSKWVDYSDKYGFGYQLSDEGVGVMFNDSTKLIMLPNGINVHYIDQNAKESYMTMENYPRAMEKKMKLLSYFIRYMREYLIKAGGSVVRELDSMSRTPHVHVWSRWTSGVLMQLNNGTVQINFRDHTKVIMCPLMAAVSYMDEENQFRTFKFSSLENNGCNIALFEKIRFAYDKMAVLLDPKNNYFPH